MHSEELPEIIKTARRRIQQIAECELLQDLYWDKSLGYWLMHIRLTCEITPSEFVPKVTEWHVLISNDYPDGKIKFFPDKVKGISTTFQHQNYNKEFEDYPFLKGDPCLNTKQGTWGRSQYSIEPTGVDRLAWHVKRCIEWIKLASTDSLFHPGDPFELPPFPSSKSFCVVFNESRESFNKWSVSTVKSGLLEVKSLSQNPAIYTIFNFLGHEKEEPNNKWGKRIAKVELENQTGIWVMLNAIPVLKPWRIPSKMSELTEALKAQGINLKDQLIKHYSILRRKAKEARLIVLGFPVPEKVGQDPTLIHWFAIELPNPPLSKGFSQRNEALFSHELNVLLSADKSIKWVKTENWNKHQLTRRGSLLNSLGKANILLVGGGALGSILAEQLVRLGVERMIIIDDEKLNAGNLSRHTLSLTDIENHKAEALARKLNVIFPFTSVDFENNSIQDVVRLKEDFLKQFDIVIDATGDDNALLFLSKKLANTEKTFVSVSMGYNAEKCYCLIHKNQNGDQTIIDFFNEKCGPILLSDRESMKEIEDVLDGVGCWHPLFPARLDDLQMLAGTAIKIIEKGVVSVGTSQFTYVQKQYDEQGEFSGTKIFNVK